VILTQDNANIIRQVNPSAGDIEKIFGKKSEQFISFVNSKGAETFETTLAKLIKFTKMLNIPFNYLFLDEVPAKELKPIADFRGNAEQEYSNILNISINESLKKQEWYRNLLIKNYMSKFLDNTLFENDKDVVKKYVILRVLITIKI